MATDANSNVVTASLWLALAMTLTSNHPIWKQPNILIVKSALLLSQISTCLSWAVHEFVLNEPMNASVVDRKGGAIARLQNESPHVSEEGVTMRPMTETELLHSLDAPVLRYHIGLQQLRGRTLDQL